jgi:small-conductance mechanosensitive channel
MDNKKKDYKNNFEFFAKGISWWFVRAFPILLLYLVVKIAFLGGYFTIFGSEQSQVMAHDFFVKILLTVTAFITVMAFYKYFFKFIKKMILLFGRRMFYDPKHANYLSNVISNILLYTFYVISLVVVLNMWLSSAFGWMLDLLKSSTTTIMSFVLGIFASSVLGNVVAFYLLSKVKEVRPGDRIRAGETYGDVLDLDFLFTHVKNMDNEIVSIPNIFLVSKGVKNYSRYPFVGVHFTLNLPHGVDVKRAKYIIKEAAKKTSGIMPNREPEVWFKETNFRSITCEVRAYTEDSFNLVKIKSDLLENVVFDLRENKIPTGSDLRLYDNFGG